MLENRTVNGYEFEFVSQNNGDDQFFECRGDVCYDDDHDETPEEGLWAAAIKLENQLIGEGYKADTEHSEKGWVEVSIINKK